MEPNMGQTHTIGMKSKWRRRGKNQRIISRDGQKGANWGLREKEKDQGLREVKDSKIKDTNEWKASPLTQNVKTLWKRLLWDTVMERSREKGWLGLYRAGTFGLCLRQNVTGLIWLVQLIGLYWSFDPRVSAAAPQRGSALLKERPGRPELLLLLLLPGAPAWSTTPDSWRYLYGFLSNFLFVIGKRLGSRPGQAQNMKRDNAPHIAF